MKYVLNVPFAEKDKAKRFGARWDSSIKKWYYDGDELPTGLLRWYPAASAKVRAGEGSSVSAKDRAGEGSSVSVKDRAGEDSSVSVKDRTGEGSSIAGKTDKYRTVSQVNAMISDSYEQNLNFKYIMVRGEVTNFDKPNRGSYYFDIKDDHAMLSCNMWPTVAREKLKFEFRKGIEVAIVGDLQYYEPYGRTSLIVRNITDSGEGAAALALLMLRKKLTAEGIFDVANKKPIPASAERIGILTSAEGKAIGDICREGKERNPYVQLVLYPTNVQGRNAVDTLVRGLQYMDAQGFDVLIIGRGGGSDEELKAFNDEAVVRAVFAAKTPIISAVGHAANESLTDSAADAYATTPTQAVRKCTADVVTYLKRLDTLKRSMDSSMNAACSRRLQSLQTQCALLSKNDPERKLKEQKEILEHLDEKMHLSIRNVFDRRKHRFEVLVQQLNGLSPTAKLVRGFGYISRDGRPLTSSSEAAPGDRISIQVHDGKIFATVDSVEQSVSVK